jgi:hypothetical protein
MAKRQRAQSPTAPGPAARTRSGGKASRPRKGRPPGAALTEDQKRTILIYVEAGGTDHRAAQAAGIAPRTFRELRQRAEGRHPTRRRLPELVEFFGLVDQARARATLKREIQVADSDPKFWLTKQAPSKPGLDGWTPHIPDAPGVDEVRVPTEQEQRGVIDALVSTGAVRLSPCPDPACACVYHREEGAAE